MSNKLVKASKSKVQDVLVKRSQSNYRILASKLFAGYPITSLAQALGVMFCKLPSENKIVLRTIEKLASFELEASTRKTILGNARKHFRSNSPKSDPVPIANEHIKLLTQTFEKARKELQSEASKAQKSKEQKSKASKAQKSKASKARKAS
jgi:hypothetical protein